MRRWVKVFAVSSALMLTVAACGSSGGGSNATDTGGSGSQPSAAGNSVGESPGGESTGGASTGSESAAGSAEASGTGQSAASGEPIKIGQIASLTGPYQALGSNDKLGAAQAVKEINASGGLLDGRPLQISVEDDKTQPDQGVIAFNKLADEKVSAVVGSSLSNASLAIIPVAERVKIPYVSTAASDEQVKPVKKYAFMAPFTASVAAEQLLRYFQAQGITKMALAYDTANAFAKAGVETMNKLASKYGVTFVTTETFTTDTTNFSSVLSHVKNSDAKGLMVWAVGPPAVAITKQFADAKIDMPLFMSHAEASTLFTKPAGAAATGIVLACALGSVGPDLPASKVKDLTTAMATTFQKDNGYYPPQFAFDGYNAVNLIAQAITDSGSTDPTKIQQALEHVTLASPEGVYKMSPDNHSGLSVDDVAIATIQSDGNLKITDWSKKQLEKTLK